MDNKSANTDQKLLFIMGGGESFRRAIDPEGITGDARVATLGFETESWRWNALLVFSCGDALLLSGTESPEGPAIDKARMPLRKGDWETIPVKTGKSLLQALSPLSGIPARLKRCLVPAGGKTAFPGGNQFGLGQYKALLSDALFWEVEGADAKTRELFRNWSIRFLPTEFGPVSHAEFSALLKKQDSTIRVSADADVYGLGNKSVVLEKNLGMKRSMSAVCKVRKENRDYPSLKVAFDLERTVPVMYWKERKEKENIGKPRQKQK